MILEISNLNKEVASKEEIIKSYEAKMFKMKEEAI